MTTWVFAKIYEHLQSPLIIMFEMGEFRNPTAILDRYDIASLVREYGVAAILATVKEADEK